MNQKSHLVQRRLARKKKARESYNKKFQPTVPYLEYGKRLITLEELSSLFFGALTRLCPKASCKW